MVPVLGRAPGTDELSLVRGRSPTRQERIGRSAVVEDGGSVPLTEIGDAVGHPEERADRPDPISCRGGPGPTTSPNPKWGP